MSPIVRLLLLGLCLAATTPLANADGLPAGIIPLDPFPAPELRLDDLDGRPYRLEEDRGALVFVHFWASWCGPCRREMPAIQRMWDALEAEGLRIALVNTAEDEETVFSFLAGHAPAIRPLMDRDGQQTEAWQPRGLPATYLVDRDGLVHYQVLGGRPWDEEPYLGFLRGLLERP